MGQREFRSRTPQRPSPMTSGAFEVQLANAVLTAGGTGTGHPEAARQRRCDSQAQLDTDLVQLHGLRLWLCADGKAADRVRITTRPAAVKCGAVMDDLDRLEFSRCTLVITANLLDDLRTNADA